MKTTLSLACLVLLCACGDDDGSSAVDANNQIDAIPLPTMPALGGTQIDRMGRAAANTALNSPFEAVVATKEANKDAYNAASDPATWATSFVAEVAKNLAITDALNQVCGDQPGYVGTPDDANTNLQAYGALAGLAVDDRLYVNTTFDLCAFYFGVEAAALGLLGGASVSDCGGRVPKVGSITQEPIDISYKLLSGGNPLSSTFRDGIDADDAQTTVSNTEFPFLAAP